MDETFLDRRLWYVDRDETVDVGADFLLNNPRPVIVLGEAGMGKSTLLDRLKAAPGHQVVTARKLINTPTPEALLGPNETLVVDALDEVAANRDGDAVDLVLRQLGKMGYPRFILSCRVADWRSATALQSIRDFYNEEPVELHLHALERSDAYLFLARTLGETGAEETLAHLEARSLAGLWANPQTLILVEKVARKGLLPASKGQLFDDATALMLREHRDEKSSTSLAEMPDEDVLLTAGGAFASMVLTGKEALSRRAQPEPADLATRDIARLPRAAQIGEILGSRLFAAKGTERFTYAHRAIGEFLGAKWLAANATTPRKQRRLLALFDQQELIPSSLRGIHAWLAWHSRSLATAVIEADPMGVVEYGDADQLSVDQGRALLKALHTLSQDNPRFRAWSEYRTAGLVQKDLLPEVADLLTAPGVEFGLRMLILQALKGSSLVVELTPLLIDMVRDRSAAFATRSEAGERLAALDGAIDWVGILDELIAEETENSIRLASEFMDEVGYDQFDDAQVLRVALALLPQSERTVGVYYGLQRKVPDGRIDALLDGVAAAALALDDRRVHPGYDSLSDLAYGLIARRLAFGRVDAETMWRWLRPFGSGAGSLRNSRKAITSVLEADVDLRRGIQNLVLLDLEGDRNVWQRSWRLSERSTALAPSEADVIALLHRLPDDDPRWREVVQLAPHSPTQGAEVRLEAKRFVRSNPEDEAWLASLENPEPPEWQLKEEKRRRDRDRKREAEWAEHRAEFSKAIDGVRAGEYGRVVEPAKAYLKLFYDIGDEAADGPGRVREWLGDEIAEAALEGFEAFLVAEPPKPTAADLAESFAENRSWDAGYIIAAAFAERLRTCRGFDDLTDERLMAGLFQLRHTRIDDHAGVADLEPTVAAVLKARGSWEAAQRLHFEPQLRRRRSHVDGLYVFMRDEADRALATSLAIEWLDAFPDMVAEAEIELVDHLLTSAVGQAALTERVPGRQAATAADVERRGLWDTVGLLLRFDETREALEAGGGVTPDLFWRIRARQAGRRGERTAFRLSIPQLTWIIQTFRTVFPVAARPGGVTSGDSNAWDASEYLVALINRLGDQASPDAAAALKALRDEGSAPYAEAIRSAAAEQKRKQVEADWRPPELAEIAARIADGPPTTASDLQAVMLEELDIVQRLVRGSPVDWYKDFYNSDGPRTEDECRDTILKMMATPPFEIAASPEGHLGDDKRADIVCTLGTLMVPIEIKGQWHPKLWTAADDQLSRLYVPDWRAECGIYLVLWFGLDAAKRVTKAPAGQWPPETPEALREALIAQSKTAQSGRNHVVVLDLTRPV